MMNFRSTTSHLVLAGLCSLFAACSSAPISEQAVMAHEQDRDCYVTGSNIKIRTRDCRLAQQQSGVQTVSPEAIQAITSKSTGGSGVKGN